MTPRERAILRDKIARARLVRQPRPGFHNRWTTERLEAAEAALDALAKRENRRRRRPCVYCGEKTRSIKNPPTCAEHRDLPALDPAYAVEEVAA